MTRGTALLDSSVWIAFFRPEGESELKAEVQRALRGGEVVTCRLVKTELLIGARDDRSYAELAVHLGILPQVPLSEEVWEEAARLGYSLRRRRVTVPLADLLIAQAALTHDLVLWHLDQHYELLRRFTPLRTRSFLHS